MIEPIAGNEVKLTELKSDYRLCAVHAGVMLAVAVGDQNTKAE
jgi:uncharacterized protein (UPF0179 family)